MRRFFSSASAQAGIKKRIAELSPFPGASVPSLESGGPKRTPRYEYAVRHTAAGVGRMTDLALTDGKGAFVLTDNNEVLLDFATGIGTVILGHSHPDVVKAVQEQAARISHAQVNISFHNRQLDLVDRLQKILPKGLDRIFFWNGGADAIEAAWKLARHATGKKNIIVFQGSYHGRTFATMGMTTSKTIYSAGFGPFVPGVHVAPFPYCLHCPCKSGPHASSSLCNSDGCCNEPIKQLELLFKQACHPDDTAAVIIEPILGEGGYVPPPPGFLKKLREICTKNKILLIADEVQTGFGRTGKYFAVQHEDVTPDILVFAKGIANGYVLSGIASTYDLMQKQPAGSMGGTFAGNVVSCAAACATIDVLMRDNILKNVEEKGKQLRAGLEKVKKSFPDVIRDVRGKGLMLGVEFAESYPYSFSSDVSKACSHMGMLLLTTSIFPTVRFIPPLNVKAAEVDLAVDIFHEAVKVAAKKN